MVCMTQRLSTFSESTRSATTSTTVTLCCSSVGIKQARPNGSGMRAIRTSPVASSVHRSRRNASSFIQRSDLFRKVPSPTSANCKRRILPFGSWSLLSTQSPSTKRPVVPASSLMNARVQPFGSLLIAIPRQQHPAPRQPLARFQQRLVQSLLQLRLGRQFGPVFGDGDAVLVTGP